MVNKLWNVFRFFKSYEAEDEEIPEDWEARSEAEHYLLNKLSNVFCEVSTHMTNYQVDKSCLSVVSFLLNDLSSL